MTTILQSCFETKFIETTTVKLKVASQKSLEFSDTTSCNFTSEMNNKAKEHVSPNTSSNIHDLGGWSFLQALSNVSSSNLKEEKMEKETEYVHPLTKQYSSSRLSEKSLELCTENLGSESGSDIMDCNILSFSLSSSNSTINENSSPPPWEKEQNLPPQVEYYSSSSSSSRNKMKHSSRNFPPPLTTISSRTNSLQIRPHREDGRLVIKAVEVPLKHPYFRAERNEGRLRLTLLEDHATKFDSQVSNIEENDVDDSEDDYEEIKEDDYDFINEEDHHHPHQLDEDDDDDEENGAYMSKNINGSIFDIDVEMGMEKFQRLINGRCNEGGHGTKRLCNWEPLLVATS